MKQSSTSPDANRGSKLLEAITAATLLLVLASVVWMVLVAYWPESFRLASETTEVLVILVLLSAALILVSAVALVHTRPKSTRDS